MEIVAISLLLVVQITIIIIGAIFLIYWVGRIFAKGILHEADKYIISKFKQLKTKKQEDGTEIKKEK